MTMPGGCQEFICHWRDGQGQNFKGRTQTCFRSKQLAWVKSLISITHPSLEEALDKINPRVTNPREILDNECHRYGMVETMFSPMDIHEESTLEHEKEDDINEHESYFMNTSSNPCSHGKSPELIDLSTTTHEIFNPLILSVHKNFERVVVDAYSNHKYCKSHCVWV